MLLISKETGGPNWPIFVRFSSFLCFLGRATPRARESGWQGGPICAWKFRNRMHEKEKMYACTKRVQEGGVRGLWEREITLAHAYIHTLINTKINHLNYFIPIFSFSPWNRTISRFTASLGPQLDELLTSTFYNNFSVSYHCTKTVHY